MLCHAMLCYAMLCYATLCYAIIIFQALDREKTGRLCFKDLTRIFADVPDIGFEKATQIAKSILARHVTRTSSRWCCWCCSCSS